MTNDSLIEKICSISLCGHYKFGDRILPLDAHAILSVVQDNMGQHKEICSNGIGSIKECAVCSEISVAELNQYWLDAQRDDLFDIIVPSDVRRLLGEISRLRLREPVSKQVSLAKCKWELSKVFVPDGIWNIEEGMKMERAVKAVLDAAGVFYVE